MEIEMIQYEKLKSGVEFLRQKEIYLKNSWVKYEIKIIPRNYVQFLFISIKCIYISKSFDNVCPKQR